MNDYVLYIQSKQKIDEMRRSNERRHWLREALSNLQANRTARKTTAVRETAQPE